MVVQTSVSKEIDEYIKKVLGLKGEIVLLKDDNYRKVNILVKIHVKELEDLKK